MTLRDRLRQLHQKRGDLHEARHELGLRTGEALLEVREAVDRAAFERRRPALTLTEAAQLLGLSRPAVYRLLEQAQKRRSP